MENKLTTYQTKLTLGEVAFIKDIKNQTAIKLIDQNSVKQEIAKLMIQTCTLMGVKNAILPTDATDIVEMILSRFKNLSIDEIAYAFKLERYGDYDDKTDHFHHFNADYVSDILKKYIRYRTKIIYEKKLNQEKKELEWTDEQKAKIEYSAVLRQLDYFLKNGEVEYGTFYVYDILDELGMIKKTDEEKKELHKQVKAQLESEYQSSLNEAKKQFNRDSVKSIEREIEKLTSGQCTTAIKKCKEMILTEFFTRLSFSQERIDEFRLQFQ